MNRALRRSLVAHVPLALAVAAILWHLRDFLPPHTLPRRGDAGLPFAASDLTPQWAPWLRVAIDALWRHGTLVFWNPFTNAGAPEFEAPQAGVVSLATLLGGVAPLEAAVKWAMLAHVIAGMLGVYALSRRLRTGAPFAALGALSFGLGTYLLDHFRSGHIDHVYAMGLTPWAMVFLWTALEAEDRWWRSASAAGVVLGVEVLEGGASALVYSLLAFCVVVVTCIGPGWTRWTLRVAGVGAIVALCFFATAAPQLLPMLSYIGLTGRSGGLLLSQSMATISEVAHPMPTTIAIVGMCLGIGALWLKGQRRAALWLAAVVALGIAAAHLEPVYVFLWHYFPGVRYQRIPQRALVMVGIAAPPLVAAGAEGVWNLLSRWRAARAVLACLGFAFFIHEAWSNAPDTPPMADPRIERRQNHAMRWLAEHAAGSRIHIWESPTRHWGADNITVPLGLESITSYTPSEHSDYLPGDFDTPDHRTFLSESYLNPALYWGMLNVRYILASSRLRESGLTLAAHVERCPVEICQPAKSAGPFVYENTRWLPRAWMVRHVIGLIGPPRPVFEAALLVMGMTGFDPANVAVLHIEPGTPVPSVDGLFAVGADVPGAVRWNSADAHDALVSLLLKIKPEPVESAGFRRVGTNRIELIAPSDGWLVISEKLALYPGWSASIKRAKTELFRADGVLTAVKVRAGNVVRASYEPPRFRLGVGLFATMVAAIVAADRRLRRRRAPKNQRVVSGGTSPTATNGYQAV